MSESHQREAAIFDAAMELPREERAAYLDQSCGGDAVLRQRIEALVKACESTNHFLDSPAVSVAERPTVLLPSSLEKAGDTIWRYKLLEQIGEGGCGVVYVAEQTEPVRRRVALKVIKLGMDTKSVIARFEAERQALAMMDHPNIAKVFDAGATETGRPYFVMELVRGMKITDYCDEAKLPTRARLNLFIQVCQAIQHAHQKGIIHRDIKPSNILVTVNDGVPVPKVIDFGIVKATSGQQLTDKTIYTAFEQFIGTPAYMSPEQAVLTSLDIDTRSDIYALGVLLYELLTGKTPFDAQELLALGLDEMRRTIREQEPPRPSTRLSTLPGQELSTTAQRRGLEAPKLVSELRGDLDWIVMKALEKDRARRYETANGLAMDIQRHLNNEPVVACPPTAAYRFQKMIRRNKLAFVASASVAAALVFGLGVAAWMFFRERTARREQVLLRQQAERAQAKEELQRRTAEDEEFKARQNLYAAVMNLGYQALERGNLGQVRQSLARCFVRSDAGTNGKKDPRGWEWRNLWQRSQGDETAILTGHSNVLIFAGMLPDNRTVVSAGRDRTLRFWDLKTRKLLETIHCPDEMWCGALSPDGRWLATGDERGCWTLWDPSSRELRFSRTNSSRVRGVAFSSDSTRIAVASARTLEVWNVQESKQIAELPRVNVDFKMGIALSPDGKSLAYSQSRFINTTNAFMLWNLETGTTTVLGTLPVGGALGLVFTVDGHLICAERSGISIWDIPTRSMQKRLANHAEQVNSVALSPDGKWLASASSDQTVRLWDTESWAQTDVFRGHDIDVFSATFSFDGKKLLSCGKDETVRVWDVEASPTRAETYHLPKGWDLMPERPETPRQLRIQIGTGGQTSIGFFDLTRCEEVDTQASPIPLAPSELPDSVSADLRKLAVLRTNGVIEVWGTMPFAKLKTISPLGARRIALSNTGRWLAVELENGQVEIRDLVMDRSSAFLDPVPAYVSGVSFFYPHLSFWAADTRFARVTQQPDELVETVDIVLLPGPEHKRIRMTHKDKLNNFSLSSDGKLLATSAWDGQVKLWDVTSGKEIHAFSGQLIAYISSAFSPDGSRLVAGAYDGSITLWDLSSFNQVAHWKAHANYAISVWFLEGGNTLVTSGAPNTEFGNWETHLWRPPSFAEIEAAGMAAPYRAEAK